MKKQFKTDDEFGEGVEITPVMLTEVYAMAEKEGVEPDPEQAALSEPLMRMILKALVGRDVYENATYFKVYNRFDPIFHTALEAIKSEDPVFEEN